jgi:hypothetical protein
MKTGACRGALTWAHMVDLHMIGDHEREPW